MTTTKASEMTATALTQRAAGSKAGRSRRHTVRLYVIDMSLLALFLLVMNVPLTGIAIHEWLGLAIGVAVVTHLLQHGDWIATTTKRIIERTSFRNQLNYWLMAGLFAGFGTIIVSGIVISEVAIPWLGISTAASTFWLWLHLASINWVLAVTAVHVALNWKWIVSTTVRMSKRMVGRRSGPRRERVGP